MKNKTAEEFLKEMFPNLPCDNDSKVWMYKVVNVMKEYADQEKGEAFEKGYEQGWQHAINEECEKREKSAFEAGFKGALLIRYDEECRSIMLKKFEHYKKERDGK